MTNTRFSITDFAILHNVSVENVLLFRRIEQGNSRKRTPISHDYRSNTAETPADTPNQVSTTAFSFAETAEIIFKIGTLQFQSAAFTHLIGTLQFQFAVFTLKIGIFRSATAGFTPKSNAFRSVTAENILTNRRLECRMLCLHSL